MKNRAKTVGAVVVVGGALKKDEKSGIWRTTRFDETGDRFGVQGDHLRVIAGALKYKINPENTIIIALGGKGQLRRVKGVEALSTVLKRELTALGVPGDKIIRESRSGTTYSQLRELKKIIKMMDLKKVQIISNKWHLPRIKAMMSYGPHLKDIHQLAEIEFVEAEAAVIKGEKGIWEKVIRRAYASKALKARIENEREGVRQIRSGKYKFVGRYC